MELSRIQFDEKIAEVEIQLIRTTDRDRNTFGIGVDVHLILIAQTDTQIHNINNSVWMKN